MQDVLMIAIYGGLAVFLFLNVLLGALILERNMRLRGNVIFLCAMMLGWQVVVICFYLIGDPAWAAYVHGLNLAFVAFSTLALLLYVIRFYNLAVYHTPFVVSLLAIIPAITAVLAITRPWHSFLGVTLHVMTRPYHSIVMERGVWFWVHSGYSYLLLLVSLAIALSQYRRTPPIYRQATNWLVGGILLIIAGSLITVFQPIALELDLSLVSGGIGIVFFHFSTRNTQGIDFLNMVRDEALNEIDKAIFVLDDRHVVLDKNSSAQRLLLRAELDMDGSNQNYDDWVAQIFSGAQVVVNEEEAQAGVDYHAPYRFPGTVFNVREKVITDRKGKKIGALMIWSDVTENRAILRKLEVDSGIDAMTGLLSRNRLEPLLDELEPEACLPLSVIMGDLNNLKVANDSRGHQQGDILLRMTAEGLRLCCPPKARLLRVGGDEFLVLIPNFSAAEAQSLISGIEQYYRQQDKAGLTVSLALGSSTKERPEQTIQQVIREADRLMYVDKAKKKAPQAVRMVGLKGS